MTKKKTTNKKQHEQASEPSLKRMPAYLHYLKAVQREGRANISAPTISRELDLDPTQIVKDLSATGVKGKPRVGYPIGELIKGIEEYMGFNHTNEAFLVGAGKLGQALLSYPDLQSFGLRILTAFDVDAEKINTQYENIKILHINKLGELAQRLEVSIGILTTPPAAAQEAAEAMVKSGIKAIWNLTPVKLKLPDDIIIQDTSMYSNVAVLLRKHHHKNKNYDL